MMRTTLTLDDDIAARLTRLRDEGGDSFKELVNALLRLGLEARDHTSAEPGPHRIDPHDCGRCFLPDLDSTHDALVFGEGENYR